MKKDHESLKKIEEFFCQYTPFPDVNAVVNIANGMSGSENVNCHNAFEEGLQIMRKIVESNFKDLKLSRKDIVKIIGSSNSSITVDKKKIEIDLYLLFQRICVVKKFNEDMKMYLRFELSPYTLTLFDSALACEKM